MAILHWALKEITYEVTATGVKLTAATFEPCHLWMRWTLIVPQEHLKPILSRGLLLHTDKRFCFVAYHDNEQEEAGDTTTHTFIKEPWASCETRYFYFHGTIGGKKSPSTSAIFSYHRVAPPYGPEQETTYPALTHDGYLGTWLGHPHDTWIDNWNAAEDTLSTAEQTMTIYNYAVGTGCSIYRGVLFFDTSALPADALITGVELHITTLIPDNPCSTNLCITPATNVHTPLVSTDYGALKETSEILAAVNIDDFPDPGLYHWTLPEAAFPHITKAGITRLGVRTQNEIEGIPCALTSEIIRIYCQEHAARPTITIKYKLPL